jgi:hypothetical protein
LSTSRAAAFVVARALTVCAARAAAAPVVAAPAEDSVLSSPWTWVGVGGAAVVIGGAAVVAAVLLQPAPVEQREPDQKQIVLTVVP